MKKLIVLVAFISLLGCGKGNDKPQTETQSNKSEQLKDITASEKNNAYKLHYDMVKGKEYKFKITSFSHQVENVSSGDSTVSSKADQNATYIMNLKFTNIDEDSILNVNCNISSINIDVDVDGQKQSYHSGVTPDSVVKAKFAEYDALINNNFDVRVNKVGEISEISKIDRMANKFLAERGYADSLNQNQKDQLRMQISEGIIRPIITQIFRELPDKSVGIDSTWSIKQPKAQVLIYQTQNILNYKFKGIKSDGNNKFAQITANLTTDFEGKNTVTNNGVTYHFQKPKAEGSGNVLFNLTDGMLQSSNTQSKIEVSFTADLPSGKNKKGSKTSVTTVTNGVERI